MNNTTNQVPYIRVFISSPGDVNDERIIAQKVIEQLPYRPVFREKVAFRIVAWDKPGAGTSMRVSMSPQDAINLKLPRPSECDIVIVIFWSRMGTELIDEDDVRYESGTHWELMDAINSDRSSKRTVVYRRTEEKRFAPDETEDLEQYNRLDTFLKSDLFHKDGRIVRGINEYNKPDDFREEFMTHFEELVLEILEEQGQHPLSNPTPQQQPDNDNLTTVEPKAWNPDDSPFPGLRAFVEDDAGIFFGRGQETDALISQLTDSRFVAIVASSGSGKSSLVGAGLIPRLRGNAIEGSKDWKIVRFTPSENPFEGLFNATVTAFPQFEPNPLQAHGVQQDFIRDMRQAPEAFLNICQAGFKQEEDWVELLLFIDQFEELFTLTNKDDAQAFVNLLATIATDSRIRVIVTLRADFYQSAVVYPELADLLRRGSFPLALPRRDALREMIESPAERAGITFEAGLIDRILDDVGNEPGNLALMAYALDELYKLDDDGTLTFAEYHELGGVQGAIGTRADNLWQKIELDESLLHQVFLRLIEVDERGTATRRRAEIPADIDDDTRQLIDAFIDARLLTADVDGQTSVATVEVAHEAILREWHTLADWIAEREADFRVVARMRRDAQWWDSHGRREQDLPRAEQTDEFWQACENLGLVIDNETTPLLAVFAQDERERLIQSLATGDVDEATYDFVLYRLRQLDSDEFFAHIAVLFNHEIQSVYDEDGERVSDVRADAIESLNELKDIRAVPHLIKALKDRNSNIRGLSALALKELEDERAIKPLIDLLNDTDEHVRKYAVAALFPFADKNLVKPLLNLLTDSSSEVRMYAVMALDLCNDELAVEPLINMLDNKSSAITFYSIQALMNLKDKRAIAPIIRLLDHDIFTEKCAEALIVLGDSTTVKSLLDILEDRSPDDRKVIIDTIRKLATVDNISEILEYIKICVHLDIVLALSEIIAEIDNGQSVEKMIDMLLNGTSRIRSISAIVLGRLRDKRAVEPLLKALLDPSEQVCVSSIKALGDIGEIVSVQPLINKFNASISGSSAIRTAIAIAVHKIDNEHVFIRSFASTTVINELTRKLNFATGNEDEKPNILSTLKAMEHPKAKEAVAKWKADHPDEFE